MYLVCRLYMGTFSRLGYGLSVSVFIFTGAMDVDVELFFLL